MPKKYGTVARLRKRKAKLIKDGVELANFVQNPLSPYHSFTWQNYISQDEGFKPSGETYHRSEKTPHKDKNTTKFSNKKLTQGDRAHFGAYANNFERLGDTFQKSTSKVRKRTTDGSAELYHDIMSYKLKRAKAITDVLQDLDYIKVGVYNDYPCLMVKINRSTIHKYSTQKKPTAAAFEAWVNYLTSIYTGIVNYYQIKAGVRIETVRRAGFGFNSPTVAATGDSIRINLGVVPEEYSALIIRALKRLDYVLSCIACDEISKGKMLTNIFYNQKSHKKYLTPTGSKQKYATPELNDIIELLWQQVEIGGRTTVQNIMNSVAMREGVAAEVTTAMFSNNGKAYAATLSATKWAAKQLKIINNSLSCMPDKALNTRAAKIKDTNEIRISKDKEFWAVITKICNAYAREYAHDKDIMHVLDDIKGLIKDKKLNRLYARLELLNEFMLVNNLKNYHPEAMIEDGFGSESEDKENYDECNVYHKKIIVNNGMRAILAAERCVADIHKQSHFYVGSAYYEVEDSLRILSSMPGVNFTYGKKAADKNRATVYSLDLNPCATTGVDSGNQIKEIFASKPNMILIIDTTSSLPKKIEGAIKAFSKSKAEVMFLVSSGLKNQQNSADRNAYGTVRVIAKSKKVLQQCVDSIKSTEPKLNSPFSHFYRRKMKELGAVPTFQSIVATRA